MTRAEQEAFEKWMAYVYTDAWESILLDEEEIDPLRNTFLAGYRAGFEKGYYHIANPDEFTGEPDDAEV